MITPSMTYKEMYDHLAADLKKVKYREEYYLPKAIKEFRKAKKFPACKWYEYKVLQTGNQYIIFFYAANRNCVEHPDMGVFNTVFFGRKRYVIRWGAGGYKHTPNNSMMMLRQIHAYTSHFFQRYNERCLKNNSLTSNDVACRYFSRNKDAMPIEINERINKNIEGYGDEAKKGFRVKDGICFTRTYLEGIFHGDENRERDKVDAMVIIYTTFMPESKMENSQRLAIEKEHIEKWTQAVEDFMKESKDGTLTLKLEP